MDEPCSIPAVVNLSDSSETDEEWLQKVQKRTSKKRGSSRLASAKRAKLDDTVQIQGMLARNGSKCKSGCRDPFRRTKAMQDLIDFRKEWTQTHKIDQDAVAPCPVGALCLSMFGSLANLFV